MDNWSTLKRELELLSDENKILKENLILVREQGSLRIAQIMTTVLEMLESSTQHSEERTEDQEREQIVERVSEVQAILSNMSDSAPTEERSEFMRAQLLLSKLRSVMDPKGQSSANDNTLSSINDHGTMGTNELRDTLVSEGQSSSCHQTPEKRSEYVIGQKTPDVRHKKATTSNVTFARGGKKPVRFSQLDSQAENSVTVADSHYATPTPQIRMRPLSTSTPVDNITNPHSRSFSQELRTESMKYNWEKRIIGEIAYQLDRRILRYIFCRFEEEKEMSKRIYGYLVSSIPEQIREDCINDVTGRTDNGRKFIFEHRYKHLKHFLGEAGYDFDIHPKISKNLVNKYGLLPTPDQNSSLRNITYAKFSQLKEFVTSIASAEEIRDVTVMLTCLTLISQEEGGSIFEW